MAATKRNAFSSIRSRWSAVLVLLMLSAPIHRTEGAEYANEESAKEKVAEKAVEEGADDAKSRIGFYANNQGVFGANNVFFPINTDPAAPSATRFSGMPDTLGGYNNFAPYTTAGNMFASSPGVRFPPDSGLGEVGIPSSGVFQMNPQMGFGAMAGYGSNAYGIYETATSLPPSDGFGSYAIPTPAPFAGPPVYDGYGYQMTTPAPILPLATATAPAPLSGGYDAFTMPTPDPYYSMAPGSPFSAGLQSGFNGGYAGIAMPPSPSFINQASRFVDGPSSLGAFQNPAAFSFSQNFGPPKPPVLMYSTGTGFMGFVPA